MEIKLDDRLLCALEALAKLSDSSVNEVVVKSIELTLGISVMPQEQAEQIYRDVIKSVEDLKKP